jgi:hypothetical protein
MCLARDVTTAMTTSASQDTQNLIAQITWQASFQVTGSTNKLLRNRIGTAHGAQVLLGITNQNANASNNPAHEFLYEQCDRAHVKTLRWLSKPVNPKRSRRDNQTPSIQITSMGLHWKQCKLHTCSESLMSKYYIWEYDPEIYAAKTNYI